MPPDHYKLLIAAHSALVMKIYDGGLAPAEAAFLNVIRAQIDILEEPMYAPGFAVMDRALEKMNRVAVSMDQLIAELRGETNE